MAALRIRPINCLLKGCEESRVICLVFKMLDHNKQPALSPLVLRTLVLRAPVLRAPILRTLVLRAPVLRAPVLRAPVLRAPVLMAPCGGTSVAREPLCDSQEQPTT